MTQVDWSQFLPNIISGLIVALIIALIAYFKSEKFKTWLNKICSSIAYGVKWFIVKKWYFSSPLFLAIMSVIIIFHFFSDWNIVLLSSVFYLLGLLGWGLFCYRSTKSNKKNPHLGKTRFVPVPLQPGVGNAYLKNRYIDPPLGNIFLGGVQFEIKQDSLVFDTTESLHCYLPLDYGGKQVDFQLPKSVNQIKSVYFLINSENSKSIYMNQSVGNIRLRFKEAPPIDIELILGKNIREWCPGNSGEYVRETSDHENITCVWKGLSKNGAIAVIDCLKIPIYEIMRGCYLEKIIFVHKSLPTPPDTLGVHYSVFGISLEIQQQPEPTNNSNQKGNLSNVQLVPSELDIEIMKILAREKETKSYWVDVQRISNVLNLPQNRADYFLRNLEKHGFVHHHMLDGKWGIKDIGIDYLVEHYHI